MGQCAGGPSRELDRLNDDLAEHVSAKGLSIVGWYPGFSPNDAVRKLYAEQLDRFDIVMPLGLERKKLEAFIGPVDADVCSPTRPYPTPPLPPQHPAAMTVLPTRPQSFELLLELLRDDLDSAANKQATLDSAAKAAYR